MSNKKFVRCSIVVAAFSFATLSESSATIASSTEKCYGIVKAGMNDCATATASCAGSATKDGQSDAFVLMPKDLCDKLVGGSLKSKNGTS